MYKTISLMSLLTIATSTSAFAVSQEQDYNHCNDTASKIFKQDSSGKKIFEIDENGSLIVANKKVTRRSISEDDATGVNKYVFQALKRSGPTGPVYSFNVMKDKTGRVISIHNKESNITAKFAFSANNCVPLRVITNEDDSIVADAAACKNIMEVRSDLIKSLQKADKCINKVVDLYGTTNKFSSKFVSEFEEAGVGRGEFFDGLKKLNKTSQKVNKFANLKDDISADLEVFHANFDSTILKCKQNFSSGVFSGSFGKVFKKDNQGVFVIKKQKPFQARDEDNSNVIEE